MVSENKLVEHHPVSNANASVLFASLCQRFLLFLALRSNGSCQSTTSDFRYELFLVNGRQKGFTPLLNTVLSVTSSCLPSILTLSSTTHVGSLKSIRREGVHPYLIPFERYNFCFLYAFACSESYTFFLLALDVLPSSFHLFTMSTRVNENATCTEKEKKKEKKRRVSLSLHVHIPSS